MNLMKVIYNFFIIIPLIIKSFVILMIMTAIIRALVIVIVRIRTI